MAISAQPLALVRLEVVHFGQVFGVAVDRSLRDPRLDDPVGDVPAQADDQDRRSRREKVVVERIEDDIGIENLCACLGETLQ